MMLERAALEQGEGLLRHFVKLDAIQLAASIEQTEQVATNVIGTSRVMVPLAGLIDVGEEVKRLEKKQQALQKEQQKLYGMLGNQNFLASAPEAVVEKNKARLAELNQQLALLQEQLSSLQ